MRHASLLIDLLAAILIAGCAQKAAEQKPAAADPPSRPTDVVLKMPHEAPPGTTVVPMPDDTTRPDPDAEPIYVKELPEVLHKVAPEYPAAARAAGVDGMVMVQALVKKDGSVGEVRVVKSIPALDEAAMACVRKWKFKPATDGSKPVPVWVGVPIKFSLH